MKKEIGITGSTGLEKAEWMCGGVIHVNGLIQNLNRTLKGGKTYHTGALIDP